jgi:uncharacterized protein YciI
MPGHVSFLKKYYGSGNFLVSGREIPRDGGIILALGREIEAIIKEDPFYEHRLADFRIIEFRASQRADDIPKRIETSQSIIESPYATAALLRAIDLPSRQSHPPERQTTVGDRP